MLHTLSTTFTMLGYLVMAFGHGRSYDSEVGLEVLWFGSSSVGVMWILAVLGNKAPIKSMIPKP
jgi:hypothetical protein